ncbi:MAG: 3-carboxy-cis,cis-muconate cycloisomerase [Alphaproteobacteria bacterium]
MTVSPLDSELFGALFGDPAVAACFSDEARLRSLLEVEAALARVEARLGVIPAAAAERIAACAELERLDRAEIRAGVERDGVPVIALVQSLREAVGADAAPYVHWGASSQDIMDSGLVLQLGAAIDRLAPGLEALAIELCRRAVHHRSTVMAGRTHGQQAVPITFGLKLAGWAAPLLRAVERLREIRPRLLVVQLGGAAGTLSALGERGIEVMEALAEELGLGPCVLPWHVQRDSLAEFASWLSLVSGSVAKMAQDVILLSQTEVGEVAESSERARGGSSTMPQKRNPMISERIVAAARKNAVLLSALHQALIQEHERGTHGWQLEWLSLPEMVVLTGGALKQGHAVAQNMTVDADRMADNLERAGGVVLAEALSYALTPLLPRAEAHERVAAAGRIAVAEQRPLVDVLRERLGDDFPDADIDWRSLAEPGRYLGSADALIDRVLDRARELGLLGAPEGS